MGLKPQTPLNTLIAFAASNTLRFAWPKKSGQVKRNGCCWYHEMNSSKSHWPQCLQYSTERGVRYFEYEVLTALCFSVWIPSATADRFVVMKGWYCASQLWQTVSVSLYSYIVLWSHWLLLSLLVQQRWLQQQSLLATFRVSNLGTVY